MGCDIHEYVEVRKDGVWQAERRPSIHRNYHLFAILANVRNGVGFAGCDTGDGFTPISEPRGLPEDVTAEVKEASDGWGTDGHSHSWVTLAEILTYDWGQHTKLRGWVSGSDFRSWKESGAAWPDRYCGGIRGRNILHVSIQELQRRIAKGQDVRNYYALAEWEATYAECAGHFLTEVLPALQALGPPEDVRLVFWFDN